VEPIAIQQAEIFSSIPPERLAELRSQLSARKVRAGEYLYFDTQPAEHLWIVRVGVVRTIKASIAGRITTLEQLGAGEIFGMAAVMGNATYNESAQAVIESEVWRARRSLLAEVLADQPTFAAAILALVARRLQGAHDRLCSFAHDSVPARIARAVLEQDHGERIEVTRRAIAEAAGTTVETAIRVLRGFQRSGWVDGGVGWIQVLDRPPLERVADGEKPDL
jgi:CRP/FNR family transcriptional regulator